ncbi:uncharacterized protein [Ptychodera flava]|uniref:uncharacterized protein n=1 Tax=Ptychodera flava TaxID=63121 RepID=UPI00396A2FB4
MEDVTNRFYEAEGNRPANEGAGKILICTHGGVDVKKVEQGSLKYMTTCGSIEALEALWNEYISGRLDKTIHSTIITETLLGKIQAHYSTLDIYIPVQEYLLCKREIPLITGSVQTPSRRRSVGAITELQATPRENVTREHTVNSLNLTLSQMQLQGSKGNTGLLSRDDFHIEELRHHRTIFDTRHEKVRLDVQVHRGKLGRSQSKKDQFMMTLDTEISSSYKQANDTVSEFVHLKVHSGQYSSPRKAVLHEAGQN